MTPAVIASLRSLIPRESAGPLTTLRALWHIRVWRPHPAQTHTRPHQRLAVRSLAVSPGLWSQPQPTWRRIATDQSCPARRVRRLDRRPSTPVADGAPAQIAKPPATAAQFPGDVASVRRGSHRGGMGRRRTLMLMDSNSPIMLAGMALMMTVMMGGMLVTGWRSFRRHRRH